MRNESENIFWLLAQNKKMNILAHTLIDDWRLVTVVNQSRQLSQVVLVGQRFVMNLYEADSKLISLVVNVL